MIEKLDRQTWQQIEQGLHKLAKQEKHLAPRDRTADKVLPLAKNYARNGEWSKLFLFLVEKKILVFSKPITARQPRPKPQRRERIRTRHHAKSFKQKVLSQIPIILQGNQALAVPDIAAKLKAMGLPISNRLCRDYLAEFAKAGAVQRHQTPNSKYVVYTGKDHD